MADPTDKPGETYHIRDYSRGMTFPGFIAVICYGAAAIFLVVAFMTQPDRIPVTGTYARYDYSAQYFNFIASFSALGTGFLFTCIDLILRTLREIRDRLPPRNAAY